MTINTAVPLQAYQDGPRTKSGTVDAADDGTGYEYTLTVDGAGSFSFAMNMSYSTGYKFSWGTAITLSKIGGATLKSILSGPGTYVITHQGGQFTVTKNGAPFFVVSDPSPVTGVRTRYSISSGSVTTQGRKL